MSAQMKKDDFRTGRFLLVITMYLTTASCLALTDPTPRGGAYHVYPGDVIQEALELAADDETNKRVLIHEGTYFPAQHGQALIWFNARYDGIVLEGQGLVILTAANPSIADRTADSYPAVVNHVVYFGDGVSEHTVLRNVKITGANGYVTQAEYPGPIQPPVDADNLKPELFFYADGGGMKVFGRSYPTIERVEFIDNHASPCAGGVSVEHRGYKNRHVTFRDVVFRNNSAHITGSAFDVLDGSSVVLENCLFVGNLSNRGRDYVGFPYRFNTDHGSGALTVFPNSTISVDRCTFTGNWNGADIKGRAKVTRSIFWQNNAGGGVATGGRYELDITDGRGVRHCRINGDLNDAQGTIKKSTNIFNAPDPQFDENYVPKAPGYEDIGYRPF